MVSAPSYTHNTFKVKLNTSKFWSKCSHEDFWQNNNYIYVKKISPNSWIEHYYINWWYITKLVHILMIMSHLRTFNLGIGMDCLMVAVIMEPVPKPELFVSRLFYIWQVRYHYKWSHFRERFRFKNLHSSVMELLLNCCNFCVSVSLCVIEKLRLQS